MTRRKTPTPDTVPRRGAIVIADQADFTATVLRRGANAALEMIWAIRRHLIPVFRDRGGEVYKIEGDNLFVFFNRANDALTASLAAHQELERISARRKYPIRIGIGIGFGDLLYLPSEDDYYGAEVNLASKLGEDLAEGGETLLTHSAIAALEPPLPGRAGAKRNAKVSDVRLRFQAWLRSIPE